MELRAIEYLGLARVLERGSGEIIAEQEGALLIRDRISQAYMLASDNTPAGRNLLERHIGQDCKLLMVSDEALGNAAFKQGGFSQKLACYQVAYYGEKPASHAPLSFRTALESDLEVLTEHYHLLSRAQLEQLVRRQSVFLGYENDRPVGFIGEHLEGSMGILYVLPPYRRRGFGSALEKQLIALTMEKGYIPFGQVQKENHASLRLQKKIGLTASAHPIVWMWK